jgi:hypothetical protein
MRIHTKGRHSGARAKRANPESRDALNLWIPGLRLTAHPGMTNSKAI